MTRGIGLNVNQATKNGVMARVLKNFTMLTRSDGVEGWYDREEGKISEPWVLEYVAVFDTKETKE